MKKQVIRIMAFGLAAVVTVIGLTVCCKALQKQVSASVVPAIENVLKTDKPAGAWTDAEDEELTEERLEIFNKAKEGLLGVDYEPFAYLGSQVVAGRNHCYLCRATVVYPNAEPHYVRVYVYEDLSGNCRITDIVDADMTSDVM